jgi:hypothetical protein
MERSEFDRVMDKLEDLEAPRKFSTGQREAWFQIFGEHTPTDAMAAVLAFHSKPFKRPAYPGDIKAHILEVEGVRLMRCGTIEANQVEWFSGSTSDVNRQLRRLISAGDWSPNDYRLYRRSELTLDEYLENQGEPVG